MATLSTVPTDRELRVQEYVRKNAARVAAAEKLREEALQELEKITAEMESTPTSNDADGGGGGGNVFNVVSIQLLAEELGKKLTQSGVATAQIIRRADLGADTEVQTRNLTRYREALDIHLGSILSNDIIKTINEV